MVTTYRRMWVWVLVVVAWAASGRAATETEGDARQLQEQILACKDQQVALSLYEKLEGAKVTEDLHAWVRAAEDPSKITMVRAISLAAACGRFIHVGDDLRDVVQRMGNPSWWRPPNVEPLQALGGGDPFPNRYPDDCIFTLEIPGTRGDKATERYWIWLLVRISDSVDPNDLATAMKAPRATVPLTISGVRPSPIYHFGPWPTTTASEMGAAPTEDDEEVTVLDADKQAVWVRKAGELWRMSATGTHEARRVSADGDFVAIDLVKRTALWRMKGGQSATIVGLDNGAKVGDVHFDGDCRSAVAATGEPGELRFFAEVMDVDPALQQAKMRCALVLNGKEKRWSEVSPPEAKAISPTDGCAMICRGYANGAYWCTASSVGDLEELKHNGYSVRRGNARYSRYIDDYNKKVTSTFMGIAAFSSGGRRFVWPYLPGPSRPLAFSADGRSLAICRGTPDGVVMEKADLTTGEALPMNQPPGLVCPLAVSDDMKTAVGVIAAEADYSPLLGDLAVWDEGENPVRVARMNIAVVGMGDMAVDTSAVIHGSDIWCSDGLRIYHVSRGAKGQWEVDTSTREGITVRESVPPVSDKR